MAREAVIEINCSRYSKKIVDIINLFTQLGWTYYDGKKIVEYLPLGDNDDFDWQRNHFSEEELQEIITKKQNHREMVGLILYCKDSDEGITILAKNTNEIVISLNINRRTIEKRRDSFTDVDWYIKNIVQKLAKRGCLVDYVKFEEYED